MHYRTFIAVLLLIALTACAPTVTPTAEPPTQTEPNPTAEVGETAQSAAEAPAAAEQPAWMTASLTNAQTGASFSFVDFAGKTVFVEPMATWCTNCRAQQQQVRAVREQLGEENYVFISLSVEPNDTTDGLREYAERENFPWIFALAPTDMLRALVDQFGRTVTNPPSTPHFVISPDGTVSQLTTGQHSADQLVAELTTAAEG